ncbi:MAG: DUF1292 domain-containing protein [Lachnospiraceae bacterium]|nr:DUF1292 domain-containing protein [Lachnospiraceae bacterium]
MDEEYTRVILEDAEGKEHAFRPVLSLAVNDREYIVLQPDREGGRDELAIFGFHAGPDDEMILDDIEDEAEYAEVAAEAEGILNGTTETEEFLVDNGAIPEEEMARLREEALKEEEEDECYEDEQGRLFIFSDEGKPVYLDDDGVPMYQDENGERIYKGRDGIWYYLDENGDKIYQGEDGEWYYYDEE